MVRPEQQKKGRYPKRTIWFLLSGVCRLKIRKLHFMLSLMNRMWKIRLTVPTLQNFHLDYKTADVIIGYRADDSYFSFASDFINGAISYRQLCSAMRLGKLGQQFVLKSRKAFEQLKFMGYDTADAKEWYKKKAFRDQAARRQYFDVERNRRQRGDLYITTILDEEMKPSDPRLR